MKKILFMFAAVAAMTFASCGNKQNSETEAVDSTEVQAEVEGLNAEKIAEMVKTGDVSALQSVVAEAQTKYQELVKNGKLDEAAEYIKNVSSMIQEHKAEIEELVKGNETVMGLVNTVSNLPSKVDDIKSQAESIAALPAVAAEGVKAAAEAKAQETVENAKETVKEAAAKEVNDAKQKVNDKVNEGAAKATDAVNNAAKKLLMK